MLGKALVRRWTGGELIGLGSAQADIRKPEQVEKVVEAAKPDWIVLSAAYTDVDGCELNPQLAAAVNTQGPINVAKVAAHYASRLLFISTDYVFDGKKTTPYETEDVRNPINAYGRSKADAERSLLEILPSSCIVRTSWLFGPGGKCFPDTILKLAATRQQIEVVNDQRGSPTYTYDLADAIQQLCRTQAQGIIHCTNRDDCSWYQFAAEIIRQAGLDTIVRPTTSDSYVRPAQRPGYSVLSPASLTRCGVQMRSWKETLPSYFAERNLTAKSHS
jgi:dTDP-4-dehydrorhamnose reductase